jgi:spermidine/putrescine transport system ATP-binding protein
MERNVETRARRTMADLASPGTNTSTSTADAHTSDVDVRIDHVTKKFGDVTAVDDLVLEIESGEFFSLLGPSGCGKTTTLRMVGGFEDPTKGSIFLAGNDITSLPPYRRPVNTVFQSYALFPHLNVKDNVAFGLRRQGLPRDEVMRRIGEMLELVDLSGFELRRPNQLSGGQQQRVALARALVNQPKVLLLDEPMGALDAKLRRQMQIELKRIQLEVGITFLYVTHDQDEAMSMSDRLAVMRAGKIEDMGTPERVYAQPATEFVSGFLGASNLLTGNVVERRGDICILSVGDNAVVRVSSKSLADATSSGQVKVGVRPEKIHIDSSPFGEVGARNFCEGVVRSATFVGVSTQYKVVMLDGVEFTVYVQNLGGVLPTAGERVRLSWVLEDTFVVAPDRSNKSKGGRSASVSEA